MKPERYLLRNQTACTLYKKINDFPVIDFHYPTSSKEIYEDMPYKTITHMWLSQDQDKWRLMRRYGISEDYITGDRSDYEKFCAYAECIGFAAGHPLYHWMQMELSVYFGIHLPLNKETAPAIWEETNRQMTQKSLSPRKRIAASNLTYIATADDPADDLIFHKKLREDPKFSVILAPGFQSDRLFSLMNGEYPDYIARLSAASGLTVTGLDSFEAAVSMRISYFYSQGCRLTTQSISDFPALRANRATAQMAFSKALSGQVPSQTEYRHFLSYLFMFLAAEYKKQDMIMQWQIRTGDPGCARHLSSLLDEIHQSSGLPQTLLCIRNPVMYPSATAAAERFPKVNLGLFCGHRQNIKDQLTIYAGTLHIDRFLGLTDSRGGSCCIQHDYFRRILCNLVGDWIEQGEFSDEEAASKIVRHICYDNIRQLLCL